jgi:hypothetical protein
MSETLDIWSEQDTVTQAIETIVAAWLCGWWAMRSWYRDKVQSAREDANTWCAMYHRLAETLPETVEERRHQREPESVPRTMRQARRRNHAVRAIDAAAQRGVFDQPTQVELPRWALPDPNRHFAERTNWPASADTAAYALLRDPAPGEDTQPFVLTEALR